MIRKYEEKDLNELLGAWHSAAKAAYPFLDEEFFKQERKNIISIYLPNAETWVYEYEGIVVGFISLMGDEVGGLFVDTAVQRMGIGRKLMDHVRGIREVLELYVFTDNIIGRAFYKKYGFTKIYEDIEEQTGKKQLRLKLIC